MGNTNLNPPRLTLECCTQCPFFERKRVYTSDSWDEAYDWICTKEGESKERVIAGFVEWHDEKPEIPEWCPLRK